MPELNFLYKKRVGSTGGEMIWWSRNFYFADLRICQQFCGPPTPSRAAALGILPAVQVEGKCDRGSRGFEASDLTNVYAHQERGCRVLFLSAPKGVLITQNWAISCLGHELVSYHWCQSCMLNFPTLKTSIFN